MNVSMIERKIKPTKIRLSEKNFFT